MQAAKGTVLVKCMVVNGAGHPAGPGKVPTGSKQIVRLLSYQLPGEIMHFTLWMCCASYFKSKNPLCSVRALQPFLLQGPDTAKFFIGLVTLNVRWSS